MKYQEKKELQEDKESESMKYFKNLIEEFEQNVGNEDKNSSQEDANLKGTSLFQRARQRAKKSLSSLIQKTGKSIKSVANIMMPIYLGSNEDENNSE